MSYLLDTGFLFSSIDNTQIDHDAVITIISSIYEPVFLPTVVTTEVAHLIRRDIGSAAVANFLDFLATSPFTMTEPTSADFTRAAEIIRQYNDSNLDFVDAIIFAMSERLHITKILTVDQRHFRMFRPKHCQAFELLP